MRCGPAGRYLIPPTEHAWRAFCSDLHCVPCCGPGFLHLLPGWPSTRPDACGVKAVSAAVCRYTVCIPSQDCVCMMLLAGWQLTATNSVRRGDLHPPHLVKALFASLQVCVLGACASQHRKQQQQFGGQVVRTAVTSTELSVPAGRGWTSARLQNTPAYEDWHPSSSAHPKKCAYLPSLSRLASSKSCESLQLLGTAPCWEPLLLQKVPGALLPSLLILL